MKGNAEKAYCKIYSKELRAVVTALKKHKLTASHKEKEEELHGPQRKIDTMFVSKKRNS